MPSTVANEKMKFPDVWQDDTRMNVLFAPFRVKSINPVEWEAKMKFWQSLIYQYCIAEQSTNFTVNSLKSAFRRNGIAPACLSTVIEELQRNGEIVSSIYYKNYTLVPESVTTWLIKALVKAPIHWTINKALTTLKGDPDFESIKFVHLSVCKELANEMMKSIPADRRGRLIDVKDIPIMRDLDEEGTLIILRPLFELKLIAVDVQPSGLFIKFKKDDEKSVNITELDRGTHALEINERQLEENIQKLEEESESALKEVKRCLAEKKKARAKTWLRRKHELDKHIEKRCSALENVRCLIDKINQAESDALVLESYKIGVAALKETFRVNGLTEEKASATMDELHDVLDVSMELEETLSLSPSREVDEELEKELEELLVETAPSPIENSPRIDDPEGSLDKVLPKVPEEGISELNTLEKRLEALQF